MTEPPKYTSRGMPVIAQETLDAILSGYAGRRSGTGKAWGQYLTEVQQRLIREDTVLVKFIEMQVGRFPRELHTPMFELLVGLYAILENQTEINKLKDMYNGGSAK